MNRLRNDLVAAEIWRSRAKNVRNQSGLRRLSLIEGQRSAVERSHSWRVKLCIKALFVRGAAAIRDWWHQSLQCGIDAALTASGNENSASCFSAARYFLAPARTTIPPPITPATGITATAAAIAASKWKPSIVRIIRVRRRRLAGNARLNRLERRVQLVTGHFLSLPPPHQTQDRIDQPEEETCANISIMDWPSQHQIGQRYCAT